MMWDFGADEVAGLDTTNVRSDLFYNPGELVANGKRRFQTGGGPVVPGVDMNIGSAHAGGQHLDQYIVRAAFRNRNFANQEARSALRLRYGLHGCFQMIFLPRHYRRVSRSLDG